MPELAAWMLTSWEAVLDGGPGGDQVQREREGVLYRDINRDRLKLFRLVMPGEVLMETVPPEGATGRNLVYRRRTTMTQGAGQVVVFLVGWMPMGPAILIDPANRRYRAEDGFIVGDPDMSPPTPHPDEGETDAFSSVTHRTDARVANLVLPGRMERA